MNHCCHTWSRWGSRRGFFAHVGNHRRRARVEGLTHLLFLFFFLFLSPLKNSPLRTDEFLTRSLSIRVVQDHDLRSNRRSFCNHFGAISAKLQNYPKLSKNKQDHCWIKIHRVVFYTRCSLSYLILRMAVSVSSHSASLEGPHGTSVERQGVHGRQERKCGDQK